MGMKYGYARVSTKDQNLARQLKQLKEENCDRIFTEKLTGATTERPELNELLSILEEGDKIIVTDLTRISRSRDDLFRLVDLIREKKAALKSLKDTWFDMSDENPYSNFLLTVMAGVNQLERELTKMRQMEGIAIAKEKGKYNGRPTKYHSKHSGMKHALSLYRSGEYTVKEITEITSVSRSALYRALKEEEKVKELINV